MEYLLWHLLERTAEQQPGQTAIRYQNRAWTYAELDARSNQLARALRSLGVRKGDRVGIWLFKSEYSAAAVYGVMKAGAAYVPLDPQAPAGRVAYILRDAGIHVLLTDAVHSDNARALEEAGAPLRVVLCLDTRPEAATEARSAALHGPEAFEVQDPAQVSTPSIESDLAYILYTSGSTGTPKGVMISHRNCLTFVDWAVDTFCIRREDRITSMAPLHFDLSTFDLYATAKAGGTVVVVPEKLAALPVKLADLWADERITVTYTVPSILSLLVQYGRLDAHDLSALRLILFAGEVFPVKYLRRLVKAVPHADYYNLYGPTETNVCTYHRVQPEDVAEDAPPSLPIGRACANTEVFAVDDGGRLVTSPGVEGELWVRGPIVARGYWGDPEKTARSFCPNPLQPQFTDTAYRTGDMVKLADDGITWLFMGRRDHMIKSRGYRIELGEIESILYRHEQVREAVAVAVPDEVIGNRVYAFVVPGQGADLTPAKLAAFCQQHLPPYMVPERFHIVSELPKTSTGKMDRPQLVAWIRSGRGTAEWRPAPGTGETREEPTRS